MGMSFREFLQDDMGEERGDIARTISKLPPSHQKLVQGYKWKFHAGNTLNGDDDHVGYMDDQEKVIAVASPWNYGREFTILHEIGHRVWEFLVPDQLKQIWAHIVANTKEKQDQEPEELFCMAYANHFVKNKIVIHDHPQWHEFIKALPQ
jgi:hypothetical protein